MNKQIYKRLSAALTMILAGLSVATSAGAVDLRDWGRKFPASQRFVVLSQFNNEAVLDKETQLVWERKPLNVPKYWESALDYCLAKIVGGRRGWRLPSIHEMTSLADPAVPVGALALPPGHPFQEVTAEMYWTATQFPSANGSYARAMNLKNKGYPFADFKGDAHYTLCVRGGGPISEY